MEQIHGLINDLFSTVLVLSMGLSKASREHLRSPMLVPRCPLTLPGLL